MLWRFVDGVPVGLGTNTGRFVANGHRNDRDGELLHDPQLQFHHNDDSDEQYVGFRL